jgi:hypothetical protein
MTASLAMTTAATMSSVITQSVVTDDVITSEPSCNGLFETSLTDRYFHDIMDHDGQWPGEDERRHLCADF